MYIYVERKKLWLLGQFIGPQTHFMQPLDLHSFQTLKNSHIYIFQVSMLGKKNIYSSRSSSTRSELFSVQRPLEFSDAFPVHTTHPCLFMTTSCHNCELPFDCYSSIRCTVIQSKKKFRFIKHFQLRESRINC